MRGLVHPPSASQQPLEQVAALQPPTQVPPVHVPPLQFAQRAPSVPQAVSRVPGWQTPLRQHPLGHVVELQLVLTHWPPVQAFAPQLMHAPPPVPQALAAVPGRHCPF